MSIVSTLVDPKNLLMAGTAVVTFATILTIAAPMFQGASLDTRMKAVAKRREELRRRSREAMVKEASLRQRDESFYKRIVDKLNLSKAIEDPKIAERLSQAGLRGPRPISIYYFFRFALPFILGAVAALYAFVLAKGAMQFPVKLLVVMLAVAAGFYAPTLYLSNAISKRRTSIVQAFPDALDLLLICVEAGMSIEAALQKVAQEIGGRSMELAEELTLLVAELSYLPERRLAYEGLTKRIPDPGIKSVATALIQAEKYGTPLGTALRVLAKENREMRLAAAEKKAAALPAKLTVPMIVFFLPVLFIVILGPAAMRIMDMQK